LAKKFTGPAVILAVVTAATIGLNVSASHAQPAPGAHSFTAAAIDEVTVTGLADPPPWKATTQGEVEPPRYYPEKAARSKAEGYATLQCQAATGGGAPHDCRVVEESPEGWNFGETAVGVLARETSLPPERAQVPDGRVFLGFAFRLKGAPVPPASLHSLRRPKFTYTPYDDELAAALRAADPKFSGAGWGLVRCTATKDGRLVDCTSLASSNPESGLGLAFVSLARNFKLARIDADGAPVAGRPIRLSFRISW